MWHSCAIPLRPETCPHPLQPGACACRNDCVAEEHGGNRRMARLCLAFVACLVCMRDQCLLHCCWLGQRQAVVQCDPHRAGMATGLWRSRQCAPYRCAGTCQKPRGCHALWYEVPWQDSADTLCMSVPARYPGRLVPFARVQREATPDAAWLAAHPCTGGRLISAPCPCHTTAPVTLTVARKPVGFVDPRGHGVVVIGKLVCFREGSTRSAPPPAQPHRQPDIQGVQKTRPMER